MGPELFDDDLVIGQQTFWISHMSQCSAVRLNRSVTTTPTDRGEFAISVVRSVPGCYAALPAVTALKCHHLPNAEIDPQTRRNPEEALAETSALSGCSR